MKKTLIKTILITLLASLVPSFAAATKFINFKGAGLDIDTVYNDDVFLYGFKVKFDSRVYGDLFTFSYEVVQNDTIGGDFMAFGYSVQNLAPVEGSYRSFGRLISCNSYVGRNLLMFGQNLTVGPQTQVGLNADLCGADVVFQGDVAGDLNISASAAVVSGSIGGNLNYEGDSLTVNPNTTINGDLNYSSPTRVVIGNATLVKGQVNWKRTEMEKPKEKKSGGFWSLFAWVVSVRGYLLLSTLISLIIFAFSILPLPFWLVAPFLWLTFGICGNILILLSKKRAWATELILQKRLLSSLGLGFILFFSIPIIALILLLTVFGAPLAIIVITLFGVASFMGGVYAALFAGRQLCRVFNPNAGQTPGYLCFTIGMALIVALAFIPILGYLIMLAALMIGLGGLMQTFFGPEKEPLPGG